MTTKTLDVEIALLELDKAVSANKLSADAKKNITKWLTHPKYREFGQTLIEHVIDKKWEILEDVFWTVLEFGTGGRRGRMYPIGSNAINDVTIAESAQGLATYAAEKQDPNRRLSCAIAYDTRHKSEHFAKLCAEVMVANGFQVYFMNEFRSTPELSFLVRKKKCSCGIMVTASHNPPTDNAVKCYWSTGGQLVPPHDKRVIHEVMNLEEFHRVNFDDALADGRVRICTFETDIDYVNEITKHGFDGPRNIRVLYSPLHGVGASAVCPALHRDGFEEVEVFDPHAEPNGNFPNVPDNVSNPENPEVYDDIITHAQITGANVILASDPDCDRLGVASPLTLDTTGPWATLSGNQIGALLSDFVLQKKQLAGQLTSSHYVVKTLVTTELIRRIANHYGVQTIGDLLVGFKWIGEKMDAAGPEHFVFGAEESHGYLVGDYARDKDGAVAAMLMAELVADLKARGQTLHQRLDELYRIHGFHAEGLVTRKMPGASGMQKMRLLMHRFRENPPEFVAGDRVLAVRDFQSGSHYFVGERKLKFEGPKANMVVLELENGNSIAIRPSGTEPKVKFYPALYYPAELTNDLESLKRHAKEKLEMIFEELDRVANSI